MLLAHKIELRPTADQANYLYQACGSRRFAYNQLLGHFSLEGMKWNKKEAQEHIKYLRASFDFLQMFSTRVVRNTVDDLDNSYKRFFKKLGGFPKFAKKNVNESFAIREKEKLKVNGRNFSFEKFPKNLKSIKMREKIRFNGVVKQVTISLRAGKWFASFLVETNDISKRKPSFENVGVDLGIKTLAVLSDGKEFPAHKSFRIRESKLRKLNKKLSRQVKDSSNWKATKKKIQRLHYFVSESRKQALHELTSWLSKNYTDIAIEDLNVAGMVKNRKLSKSIIDSGFGMFKEQMKYKCLMYGSNLKIIDRWFPSSKLCSNCGNKKEELKLSERIYKCSACGFEIDRDLNASINIREEALKI